MPEQRAMAQTTPTDPATSTDPTAPIADGTGGPSTLTVPAPPADGPDAKASVDLATGAAQSAFAFRLAKARGEAQPTLALTYSSSVGVGFAGVGWTLTVPSVVRKGAAGMPRFTNDVFSASPAALAAPNATFDDYLVDGQLLVPICAVGACGGANLAPNEVLPTSLAGSALTGWMYFRREVDDLARYFFSPDGQTWLKQEKSGVVTQFGHPLDAAVIDPAFSDGIERPAPFTNFASPIPAGTAAYRWNIVRKSDASGNTAYYTYTNNASLAPGSTLPDVKYLSDIYDTLAVGRSPAPGAFAHHIHLTWQLTFPIGQVWTPAPGAVDTSGPGSYVTPPLLVASPLWRSPHVFQLSTVDVTSASWSSLSRGLVRRYSLAYQSNVTSTRNRLTTITLEGECQPTGGAVDPVLENANGLVSQPSGCASAANTMQLASYGYYPDTIGGGGPAFSSITPAFSLSSPPGVAVTTSFVDVDGDGASEFISTVYGSPNTLAVQSFGASASTTLADPTGGTLIPGYFIISTGPAVGSPNPPLDYPVRWNPLMLGDWLVNGKVNWLTSATGSTWSAYSPQAGTFTATPVDTGRCQSWPFCYAGRAFDVDGDGLTDQTLAAFPGVAPPASTYFTQRAHDGSIIPFAFQPPPFNGWGAGDVSQGYRAAADMDGDGLVDITSLRSVGVCFDPPGNVKCQSGDTIQTRWVLDTWLNHGDGIFGATTLDPTGQTPNPVTSYAGVTSCVPGGTCTFPESASSPAYDHLSQMADLNADGFDDSVSLYGDSLQVCLRYNAFTAQAGWRCFTAALPVSAPPARRRSIPHVPLSTPPTSTAQAFSEFCFRERRTWQATAAT